MTAGKHTARFTTAGRLTPIETWLKLNIEGQWTIKLESISDDMSKKSYALTFEDEGDCNAFKIRFTPAKAAKASDRHIPGGWLQLLSSRTATALKNLKEMPVRAWIALGRPFYTG